MKKGQLSLTCDDQDRLMEDIGFAKGILDLLYGNMSSEIAFTDLMTDSVSLVISEARGRLARVLETIDEKVKEVQP